MKSVRCLTLMPSLKMVLMASLISLWAVLPASAQSTDPDPDHTTRSETSHRFELARQYYGDCQDADDVQFEQIQPYLKAFTDMEVMADMMSNPAKFSQLMTVVNDPRTIHVMTRCATEPVMWETWMSGMTDLNKVTRAMMRFMNPNMYMAWMMAPMNPGLYRPMMQFMHPAYFNRWMTALTNPVFYQPIASLVDPDWHTPRIQWMLNPMSPASLQNWMSFGVPGQTVATENEMVPQATDPTDTQ